MFSGLRLSSRHLHNITPPSLPLNAFTSDPLLPRLLSLIYSQHNISPANAQADLTSFGARYTELYNLSLECEANPPRLERLDGWGARTDRVVTCSAWQHMHHIAATQGILATGHEGSPLAHIHQAFKLHLFSAVSGMVGCPLAMTDGAVTTLNKLLATTPLATHGIGCYAWRDTLQDTVTHLTSRDPQQFWTSGQWMTERRGGSDVTGATETYAVETEEGHVLCGNKFYTSAIDCTVALALAKCNDNLSLFLVHLPSAPQGAILIDKLKDKLGTRQLPTAELTLNCVPALLLAEKGVANIIPMLQVTRLYNAITASSYLRHVTSLARSYAATRTAFGKPLNQLPLHRQSLARLETLSRGVMCQSIDLAIVLHNELSVGRVLSAVVKLYTALRAVEGVREGLECFGGAGYMEDTGLPLIFRDACVLPVWEGTTDVLAIETMRALQKPGTLADILKYLRDLNYGVCGETQCPVQLVTTVSLLEEFIAHIEAVCDPVYGGQGVYDAYVTGGRGVAIALGAAHAGAVLVSIARNTQDISDIAAAALWCRSELVKVVLSEAGHVNDVLDD